MSVPSGGPATVHVFGVPVARLTAEAALAEVERLYEDGNPTTVVYVNAHTLNLAAADPEYRALLMSAGLVLNDGAGLAIAGRLKGAPFPENLNGSDFNPRILELAARRGWRVFFLGGRPGVAELAVERLHERIPGFETAGSRNGFFRSDEADDVVAEVREARPDLVMVALGNPRQELWLSDHLSATGAVIGVGVGAFFDFSAGVIPRAPKWMNRLGIEWLYRLSREPRRLWRRYIMGNPLFLGRLVAEIVRERRSARAG
ncbi:MAG TPA: WecB/TagA/CpsF family glycosyltransferase [Actinomycetota bacterium]|nr:WecB/TagA/CpsF family glycosyltransferase [Actinomycetota bacterium]